MKYVINWVVFKRTCEVSEIQFTKHFIEFVFVETNEVVRTSSNMMLARQTCGHCLRRAVGSKRRALAFYFSVRIRCMFLISTCEGKSDLGVCMTSVLPRKFGRTVPTSDLKTCLAAELVGSRLHFLCKYRSHAHT